MKNESAFPTKQIVNWTVGDDKNPEPIYEDIQGLTKREYIAIIAMPSMISKEEFNDIDYESVSKKSVKMADALINELSKADKK